MQSVLLEDATLESKHEDIPSEGGSWSDGDHEHCLVERVNIPHPEPCASHLAGANPRLLRLHQRVSCPKNSKFWNVTKIY
jgi:hypothetical protein